MNYRIVYILLLLVPLMQLTNIATASPCEPNQGACPSGWLSGVQCILTNGAGQWQDDGAATGSSSCWNCAPGDIGVCTTAAPSSGGGASSSTGNAVICSLYTTYTTVTTAIFVIGILLMLLGGAIYAASHIMPGQTKGTLQGYAMGMIMGGVIGVIIALLAPYIFSLIGGGTAQAALANAAALGC